MAKPSHDPRQIFLNAERFGISAVILRKVAPRVQAAFLPSAVLKAFSLELYFKCLIAIETGKPPPTGHNLRWLFDRLNGSTKTKIKHYFDNPAEQEELDWREKNKNPPAHFPEEALVAPYTFDNILDKSAKAFSQLRYIFERGLYKPGPIWSAGYIVTCARRVIVETHPEWDKPEANYYHRV